uniref:Uncharacterized protein n=1 Tax=Bactrocera dorsalis TaxID=27457 RepID=A0A034VV55_BACDO
MRRRIPHAETSTTTSTPRASASLLSGCDSIVEQQQPAAQKTPSNCFQLSRLLSGILWLLLEFHTLMTTTCCVDVIGSNAHSRSLRVASWVAKYSFYFNKF